MALTIEPGLCFSPAILRNEGLRATLGDSVRWSRAEEWLPFGGIRIEDDILVTASEPDVLTHPKAGRGDRGARGARGDAAGAIPLAPGWDAWRLLAAALRLLNALSRFAHMAEQTIPTWRRPFLPALVARMREPRRFIQVLAGPRQVGKTTLARQLMEELERPSHYATADVPGLRGQAWVEQQWEVGRIRAAEAGSAVLVLDEIQKLPQWSEVVKLLWDADTRAGTSLAVVLLGSAPLLLQAGLTESLAGRFELLRVAQWSYAEMRDAFGWDFDRYVYFGGYPGAAPLIEDEARWAAFIRDSLIETTVSRDILLMRRIDKPALLRQLFELGCRCSGQIVSYTKMLGQLHDAGNTTTLAHYLELLSGAGLLSGLPKYTRGAARQRASSPKLQVHDTALVSATAGRTFREARSDPAWWGRLVESAVGAHLLREAASGAVSLSYWREGSREVDFVLRRGDRVTAIEVKSSHTRDALPGMDAFARVEPGCRKLLAGPDGLGIGELLLGGVVRLV